MLKYIRMELLLMLISFQFEHNLYYIYIKRLFDLQLN